MVCQVDEHNVNTEGSELAVLQSINFDQVKIDCIIVENNFRKKKRAILSNDEGYRLAET